VFGRVVIFGAILFGSVIRNNTLLRDARTKPLEVKTQFKRISERRTQALKKKPKNDQDVFINRDETIVGLFKMSLIRLIRKTA